MPSSDFARHEGDAGTEEDASSPRDLGIDAGPEVERPEYCPVVETGRQDVTGTPASPYFLEHPTSASPDSPTVVMIPGVGTRFIAEQIWALYLAEGRGRESFRLLMPYTNAGELTNRQARTRIEAAVDELLACFGGDPDRVHLAGVSSGGIAAYNLVQEAKGKFASLLGAPGVFAAEDGTGFRFEADAVERSLAGKSVFHGVGEFEERTWRQGIELSHQMLVDLGIDSQIVEFPGEGHIVSEAFDETIFFDFWSGQ